MNFKNRLLLSSSFLLCWSLAAFGAAADSQLETELERLFAVGWRPPTIKTRAAVGEQYDRIRDQGIADSRATYGYAIVLMRQRRYQEADRLLGDLVRGHPGDVAYLRAKVWLSVITKKYDRSLLELEQLGKALGASTAETASKRESARFLGRIYGFLNGPVADRLPEDRLAARQLDAQKAIGEQLTNELTKARRSVLDRYADFSEERRESIDEAKAEAEKRKQEQLRDLADQRERLKQQKGEVEERRDKLESEKQKRLDALSQAMRPLEADRLRVDAQRDLVTRELIGLSADINRYRRLLDRTNDPVLRDRYLVEISRLDRLASQYEADALTLDRQRALIDNRQTELFRQHQFSRVEYDKLLNRGVKKLNDLKKAEKRTDVEERRVRRPPRTVTRKARALSAQAAALTTYDPFPLEREKQRLMQSFREE